MSNETLKNHNGQPIQYQDKDTGNFINLKNHQELDEKWDSGHIVRVCPVEEMVLSEQ